MSQQSRWLRAWGLVLPVVAVYALGACGGAADATGPGNGSGNKGQPSSNDLYVSTTTGNNAGAGTQDRPLLTVASAIAIADSGQTIRVAGGMYYERLLLRSHLQIVGGYDPTTWQRDSARFPTIIGDSTVTVRGTGVTDVVLDGLHLTNLRSSYYGVVMLDSSDHIQIRGSTITAPIGWNGSSGFTWEAAANGGGGGAPGMPGATCPPSRTGGVGGNDTWAGGKGGTGGTGGLAGGFAGSAGAGVGGGAAGAGGAAFATGAAGKTPTAVGAKGDDGTGGAAGFGQFTMRSGYVPVSGTEGQVGASGVGGGGGGGGGGDAFLAQCGGGGGGGGQGGEGGWGGYRGVGGYASIGVALGSTSRLELDNSVVITAGGGKGGNGAGGQAGGAGGAGGKGGAASVGTGAGGTGGAGGVGGPGGAGGAGAGGPSIGVLLLGNAALTATGVTYQIGPPGAPGSSPVAGGAAVAGDSASVKVVTAN